MMKKTIMFLCLLATSLGTYADNVVSVSSALIPEGKSGSFNIELSNTDEYVAFQMNITLPEGISFVSATKGNRYADNHSMGVATHGQTTTITMNSATNAAITGNSGALLTVTVTADASLTAGTTLKGTLSNMEFAQLSGAKYNPEAFDFTIEITDRVVVDENATVAPAAQSGANVLVKRTIKKDVWNTVCLPFALNKTKAQAAFGEDVQVVAFDGFESVIDEETLVPSSITVNFKTMSLSAITTMKAGTPYLVKTSQDIESFEVDNVTIVDATNDVTGIDQYELEGKFKGTFVPAVLPADALFISGNKFYYSKGSTNIKGLRGWFELSVVLGKALELEAPVYLNIDGQVTRISGVERTENGENESFFNLNGMRVDAPNGKGIYIRNGKKVVVK